MAQCVANEADASLSISSAKRGAATFALSRGPKFASLQRAQHLDMPQNKYQPRDDRRDDTTTTNSWWQTKRYAKI